MKNFSRRIQKLENDVFMPTHGAAIDMVRKHWQPDFSGDVRQALAVMHEETLKEANRLENRQP